MRKTALGPTEKTRFSGRVGIEDYLHFHYCPSDRMRHSVASTLEYCYADYAGGETLRPGGDGPC
jgi:putative alpha-1,2-mannosidase